LTDRADRGQSDPERYLLPLIGEFLEAQFAHHETGGYPGLAAEPIADGLVRVNGVDEDRLMVFCSRVFCELPDRPDSQLAPCLYFYVCRDESAEGFVVAAATLLDGLRNLHPAMSELAETPLLAFEGGEPEDDPIEVGVPLELGLSVVGIEQPSGAFYQQPPTGIRFELTRNDGTKGATTFSDFTMPGITPLLAVAVGLNETPTDPPTFSDELDDLNREIEARNERAEEEGGS
jgi:hypothetical protein